MFCDVDDTLVIWDWKAINPDGVGLVSIDNYGTNELVMPHNRHVQLLKQFKARGHTVVVWSQGGHQWAENVVRKLGIEESVDIVMDKPNWYIDDLPSEVFMKAPIYLDPMNPNKDKRWGLKEEHDLESKGD